MYLQINSMQYCEFLVYLCNVTLRASNISIFIYIYIYIYIRRYLQIPKINRILIILLIALFNQVEWPWNCERRCESLDTGPSKNVILLAGDRMLSANCQSVSEIKSGISIWNKKVDFFRCFDHGIQNYIAVSKSQILA